MRGPCAKRRVICTILKGDRFVDGENDCANPQKVCPRNPGDDYTKCKTICQQAGHAELEALRKAREVGMDTNFATVYIRGHYWICEPCGQALREAGVAEVRIESRCAQP